ncbi:hypothetical protein QTN25_000081 [Entamoeba marina]
MSGLLIMLLFTGFCTITYASDFNDNMEYSLSSSITEMNNFDEYATYSDYHSFETTEISDFMDALTDTSLVDYMLNDDGFKSFFKDKLKKVKDKGTKFLAKQGDKIDKALGKVANVAGVVEKISGTVSLVATGASFIPGVNIVAAPLAAASQSVYLASKSVKIGARVAQHSVKAATAYSKGYIKGGDKLAKQMFKKQAKASLKEGAKFAATEIAGAVIMGGATKAIGAVGKKVMKKIPKSFKRKASVMMKKKGRSLSRRLKKKSPKFLKNVGGKLKKMGNKMEEMIKKSQMKSLVKKRAKAVKKVKKNRAKAFKKIQKAKAKELKRINQTKQKQLKRQERIVKKEQKLVAKKTKALEKMDKKMNKEINKAFDRKYKIIKKSGIDGSKPVEIVASKKGTFFFIKKLDLKKKKFNQKKNKLIQKQKSLSLAKDKASVLKEEAALSKKLLKSENLQKNYWSNARSKNLQALKNSKTESLTDKIKKETLEFNNAMKNTGTKIANSIEEKSPGLKGKAKEMYESIVGSTKLTKNFKGHMDKLKNYASSNTSPFRTVLTSLLKDKATEKVEDGVKDKVEPTLSKAIGK